MVRSSDSQSDNRIDCWAHEVTLIPSAADVKQIAIGNPQICIGMAVQALCGPFALSTIVLYS